jgi:hypothetical protein
VLGAGTAGEVSADNNIRKSNDIVMIELQPQIDGIATKLSS